MNSFSKIKVVVDCYKRFSVIQLKCQLLVILVNSRRGVNKQIPREGDECPQPTHPPPPK